MVHMVFFSVDLNEESNKSKAEKRVNVSHVHIVVKGNFESVYPQLTSRLNVHSSIKLILYTRLKFKPKNVVIATRSMHKYKGKYTHVLTVICTYLHRHIKNRFFYRKKCNFVLCSS